MRQRRYTPGVQDSMAIGTAIAAQATRALTIYTAQQAQTPE
jgi:hypothetical protein